MPKNVRYKTFYDFVIETFTVTQYQKELAGACIKWAKKDGIPADTP